MSIWKRAVTLVGLSLVGACYSADANDPTAEDEVAGVSARLAADLTVAGYRCPTSGEIAGRTRPADHQYYVTTFGGGADTQRMSCGGTADGRWLYIADSWRFGCGSRVKVTNPRTGRWCVTQVADIGPNICVERAAGKPIIDASPAVTRELFDAGAVGWSQRMLVLAEPVAAGTALGCGSGATPPPTPPPTPTPSPSPTPMPSPAVTTMRVTASSLNVRSGAGTSYTIRGSLSCGTTVTVLAGPSSGWWNVSSGGLTGWASGMFLVDSAAFDAAVCGGSAPPPPPPPPPPPVTMARPTPGQTWHIDLEAPVDTAVRADWYDIDLFDNSASVVSALHARGGRVVCYFSAGSSEDWRPDFASFPRAALGSPLDGWPGERWLDVRDAGVRRVMQARLDRAVALGCDGVDPDNVDGYANANGFGLTASQQLAYNRWLAAEAHARGLVVGLKNDVDQIASLVSDYDFAVNEQCFAYGECDQVAAFTRAGKGVLHIEYGPVASLARTVCSRAAALRFDTILSAADRLDGTYTRCP